MINAATFGEGDAPLSAPRAYQTSAAALLSTGTNGLAACTGGIELRFGLTPDATEFAP